MVVGLESCFRMTWWRPCRPNCWTIVWIARLFRVCIPCTRESSRISADPLTSSHCPRRDVVHFASLRFAFWGVCSSSPLRRCCDPTTTCYAKDDAVAVCLHSCNLLMHESMSRGPRVNESCTVLFSRISLPGLAPKASGSWISVT